MMGVTVVTVEDRQAGTRRVSVVTVEDLLSLDATGVTVQRRTTLVPVVTVVAGTGRVTVVTALVSGATGVTAQTRRLWVSVVTA